MNGTEKLIYRLTTLENRALTFPATLTALAVNVAIIFSCFGPVAAPQVCLTPLLLALSGIGYLLMLYFVLLPLTKRLPAIFWGIALINAFGIAILPTIAPPWITPLITALVVAAVIVSSILAGRWPTYFFILVQSVVSYYLHTHLLNGGSPELIYFMSLPVISVMITETILRLSKIINTQMRHLEIINMVSHRTSSTLEPEELISLVNQALQDTRLADTYFFGLVKDNKLHLEVFYDNGEFFPPMELSMDGSLSGWVARNRRSLLLKDLTKETRKLNIAYQPVGQPHVSLSWMGTPMESSGKVLGVMAMASYRRSAFSEQDLKLLENIAQQTALVIDNAYHHAEVTQQSRLDSLTGVYNHGYFLVYLKEFVEYSRSTRQPLGLIMLDIDFFKIYNDKYGHQVGDQVLNQVVTTIRENIRSTDVVGRWGGEEFAIILGETNILHATQVAERIRQSLENTRIITSSGESIPAPTVSQGIAICPDETADENRLVQLADQRLYQAKDRGRNQVEHGHVHGEHIGPDSQAVIQPEQI
jgi:diguanylate cyclase (GGDEF)-like protein